MCDVYALPSISSASNAISCVSFSPANSAVRRRVKVNTAEVAKEKEGVLGCKQAEATRVCPNVLIFCFVFSLYRPCLCFLFV